MINVYLNNQNITGMVEGIEWYGSAEEVARSCDISYINAPYDPIVANLPRPTLGNYVTVVADGSEIFFGRIVGSEKSSAYGTLTANCVEDINALAKNKCKYNFSEPITPEEITAVICADYEFPTGSLAGTGVEITSLVINGQSIIDAIALAYEEATKITGKRYRVYMQGHALCVAERGSTSTTYTLSEDSNITESHFTEHSNNLVNHVVLYDENGERIGEVSDGASMATYGTYTEMVQAEINVDAETQAASLMKGPDQSLSVTALGNISCVSGNAVQLMDSATGMYGTYWIQSDHHTFRNNVHTMQLELSFKELGE